MEYNSIFLNVQKITLQWIWHTIIFNENFDISNSYIQHSFLNLIVHKELKAMQNIKRTADFSVFKGNCLFLRNCLWFPIENTYRNKRYLPPHNQTTGRHLFDLLYTSFIILLCMVSMPWGNDACLCRKAIISFFPWYDKKKRVCFTYNFMSFMLSHVGWIALQKDCFVTFCALKQKLFLILSEPQRLPYQVWYHINPFTTRFKNPIDFVQGPPGSHREEVKTVLTWW